jgi:hypothetical protein
MISRQTIGSLLLALLLGVGVKIWAQGSHDACDRVLPGDAKTPEYESVQVGPQVVMVPCRIWFLRQPPAAQGACLAGIAAGVVFVVSAGADVKRSWEIRRGAS